MFFAIHPDLSNIPAAYLPTSSHNIYGPGIIIVVIVAVLVSPVFGWSKFSKSGNVLPAPAPKH